MNLCSGFFLFLFIIIIIIINTVKGFIVTFSNHYTFSHLSLLPLLSHVPFNTFWSPPFYFLVTYSRLNNPKQKEQCSRYRKVQSQIIPQSHSNKSSLVLAQKGTYRLKSRLQDQKTHSYHISFDKGVSRDRHCFLKRQTQNPTNHSLVNGPLNSTHSSLKEMQMPDKSFLKVLSVL